MALLLAVAGPAFAQVPPPVAQVPPLGGPNAPPLPAAGIAPALGPEVLPRLSTLPLPRAHPPARFIRGISDGLALIKPGLAPITLRRGARAGAQVARLPLLWDLVERGSPVDPLDPADPAYDFAAFDALVRESRRAGLVPLVRVSGAPAAHEPAERWPFAAAGTWSPDPEAYGRFAVAAARRYSGHFPDPLAPGRALPRVRWWQAWNEPNLPQFLQPQWVSGAGGWRAWSPAQYRRMLNAFYRGIKSVDPAAVVATAGTAPYGDLRDGEGRMTPVRFWQELLCLGSGARPRPQRCDDPAHFDVLVHHPLTATDPDRAASDPGNVGVADLHKLRRLLALAQRSGRVVPARPKRIWLTEFNWVTGAGGGASSAQIQRWVPRALFRLWREGVELVSWQFVRDPPGRPERTAGLYAIDRRSPLDAARDRPKRAVLRAFGFPLTGERQADGRLRVWALVPGHGSVRLQCGLAAGRWVTVRTFRARPSRVLSATVRLPAARRLRLVTATRRASTVWHVRAGRRSGARPTRCR